VPAAGEAGVVTDPRLYSRRTTRRLRLLALTFVVGYAVSSVSFYMLCTHLFAVFGPFGSLTLAGGGSILTAGGLTAIANIVHKSLWPEHPDDGHE
jgi:hypothetical protein